MTPQIVVAGGGIGGLAASIACARAGWPVRLFERTAQFREFGAGIQMGPNATRILREWNLESALRRIAAFPSRLQVRSAHDGATLGVLRLGDTIAQRYGAPYATVHRADLQQILVEAARASGVHLALFAPVSNVRQTTGAVLLRAGVDELRAEALIGADGLWGNTRQALCNSDSPRPTGHVAYRGLAEQSQLPREVRSDDVTVWLGPRLHVVAYPVRAGAFLNVVAITHGKSEGPSDDWNQEALAVELQSTVGDLCAPLRDLVRAMPAWRLWTLNERPPISSAAEMAKGRIALLGDAAHPMRPYLAQGAGMAIEDAAQLARELPSTQSPEDVPAALHRYAAARWERCARVQWRSRSNGRIFHATGPIRWARDRAIGLLGERLLDVPWLYGA
jgi:salicylate hydroxylase